MNVKQLETTYISRQGQHLNINLAQPELKKWLTDILFFVDHPMARNSTLDGKIKAGLSIIAAGMKYDQLAQTAEYKPKHLTATHHSESAGLLFYSTQATEPHKSAGLGHLIHKNAMVCREKAMLTHLFLAEMGIPTRYQPGSVTVDQQAVDGHCWVEWTEPATGRNETVEAVIDGTWGKVYVDFYYDEHYVTQKLDSKVYFEPVTELDDAEISQMFGRIKYR